MDNTSIGVANANFVTPFLAVGGDIDLYDEDLAVLQTVDRVLAGITHVLDVRQEADDELWWADVRDVTYRWAGIDDAGQRIPVTWFEDVVTWALAALDDPSAKLLTHCHMGINRGPSVGYAVLLGLGWDPVDASMLAIVAEEEPRRPATGLVIGVVTDNQDPEGQGRVKVKFPWLGEPAERNVLRDGRDGLLVAVEQFGLFGLDHPHHDGVDPDLRRPLDG